MNTVIAFFARRHMLALLLTLMILLAGVTTLFQIKRDIYPKVDFGELIIVTTYRGASAEDVELNVTNKIEKELKTVTGLKEFVSFSTEGLSRISAVIDPDVSDEEKVKRDIRNAVDRVTDFPAEVTDKPLVQEIDTSVFPIIEVGLIGDLPYPELRELAKQFEKRLENVSGVSKVESFGYLDREIKVNLDPQKLDLYQLSMYQVSQAISQRNVRSTGGNIYENGEEKSLITLAQFDDPQDVSRVIVRSNFDGQIVRVSDLAVVHDGFEEAKMLNNVNGEKSISFLVFKSEPSDILRLSKTLSKVLKEEEKRLPKGVSITTSDDMSTYVKRRLSVVISNGFIGLALVLGVLTLFFNFKTAFWVALGIPVSVLGVIFMLPIFNTSLDLITLMAIIIVMGIIVDDAIIISENIASHRERGEEPVDAAIKGASEVFYPVLTTVLTTFLAFAPMFFMSGIMGKFIYVIPLVITLALFVSLFEVTLALPAHMVPGLKTFKKSEESKVFKRVIAAYEQRCKSLLKRRYIVVFGFIIFLVLSFTYAKHRMDFILFPPNIADRFIVNLELPTGYSLEQTREKIKPIEDLIRQLPKNELDSFRTRIGMNGNDNITYEASNKAMIFVGLTNFSMRSRTADDIIAVLREGTNPLLPDYKKIQFSIDGGGPPVGKAVTIRIIDSNNIQRDQLAERITAQLEKTKGVKDIDRDDEPGKRQILTNINFSALSRLGLTVSDVTNTLRTAYSGQIATNIRYGDEDVDFRVQLPKSDRTLDTLRSLTVPNNQGRLIRLQDVLTLDYGPGQKDYYHFDGERSVTITADVDKTKNTPQKATKAALRGIDLDDYPGAKIVIGGETEETNKSMVDLLRSLMLAMVGIYFLLVLLFNSLLLPFLVMTIIPFGFSSVIVAFALHNEPLGFIATLGIIGLAGVLVNDSLVLVYRIIALRKEHPKTDLITIVTRGASSRLRPVLVTSFTTVAGLLPLAYGIGGEDPFIAPMALALGYGIFLSTPVVMILVPSLFMVFDDIQHMLIRCKETCKKGLLERP